MRSYHNRCTTTKQNSNKITRLSLSISRTMNIIRCPAYESVVSQLKSPFLGCAIKARVNFSEIILRRIERYLIAEVVVETSMAQSEILICCSPFFPSEVVSFLRSKPRPSPECLRTGRFFCKFPCPVEASTRIRLPILYGVPVVNK
jgi:hypothetical protein